MKVDYVIRLQNSSFLVCNSLILPILLANMMLCFRFSVVVFRRLIRILIQPFLLQILIRIGGFFSYFSRQIYMQIYIYRRSKYVISILYNVYIHLLNDILNDI